MVVSYFSVSVLFLIVICYGVVGSFLSWRLARHLSYKDGFYKLFLVVQQSCMTAKKIDFELEDELAKKMHLKLTRVVYITFASSFCVGIISFVSQLFGW